MLSQSYFPKFVLLWNPFASKQQRFQLGQMFVKRQQQLHHLTEPYCHDLILTHIIQQYHYLLSVFPMQNEYTYIQRVIIYVHRIDLNTLVLNHYRAKQIVLRLDLPENPVQRYDLKSDLMTKGLNPEAKHPLITLQFLKYHLSHQEKSFLIL